jgi:hypothetical protein
MADTISRVEHYTINVKHEAGAGAAVLRALAAEKVNLIGFWGYPIGSDEGVLELIPEDAAALKKAAKKARLDMKKGVPAFFVCGKDRPGAVGAALGKLGDAGINVHAAQAACGGAGRYGAIIFVQDEDVKRAGKVLGV